jgi:glycerol-3-phosphate dehydrogenase
MGGKLTTYRKMSEHTVDEVVKHTGKAKKCKTKNLQFIGAKGFKSSMLNGPDAYLAERFGSELNRVKDLIAHDASLGEPLIAGLPYLRAEAVFACRNEMALTLDDVLSRRTRARIINRRATLASARKVAELMATELHWDSAEIDRQVAIFVDSCSREEAAGMVSEAEFLASVQ